MFSNSEMQGRVERLQATMAAQDLDLVIHAVSWAHSGVGRKGERSGPTTTGCSNQAW